MPGTGEGPAGRHLRAPERAPGNRSGLQTSGVAEARLEAAGAVDGPAGHLFDLSLDSGPHCFAGMARAPREDVDVPHLAPDLPHEHGALIQPDRGSVSVDPDDLTPAASYSVGRQDPADESRVIVSRIASYASPRGGGAGRVRKDVIVSIVKSE